MSFMAPNQRAARNRRRVLLSMLGVIVIVVAGLFTFLFSASSISIKLPVFGGPVVPTSTQVTNSIPVMPGPDSDLIGLSDSSYAFDMDRPSRDLKRQASEKLRNGDRSGALALWRDALEQDTSDAEALIYQEDQLVLDSGKPYITLVVGTALTGKNPSAISVGRDTLQGAYVAQKEYNDKQRNGNGKLLRLLIANAGSDASKATDIARQIVQAATHQDQTIIGVMGWTLDRQTLNAVQILSTANIPMVSPTASSDDLTKSSSYFFRVVPSNKTQAVAGAHYVEQQLHAQRVAIFVDSNDLYSSSLSNDFGTQFRNDGKQIVATEQYKVGNTEKFPMLLRDALSANPDLIYFAGNSSDVSALLELRPSPPVMGGDALYALGGYTRIPPVRDGFTHLQFTSFAYPDEWDILGLQSPPFFTLYPKAFDPHSQYRGQYGFSRPPGGAMLSYDATEVLLKGYANASTGQTAVTPQALQQGLTQIRGNNAVQGVTGQISLGSDGDPINKAVVVLHVVSRGYIQVVEGGRGIDGCFRVEQQCNTY